MDSLSSALADAYPHYKKQRRSNWNIIFIDRSFCYLSPENGSDQINIYYLPEVRGFLNTWPIFLSHYLWAKRQQSFKTVIYDQAAYCGAREHHEYQLYLTIENVDHTMTKAKSRQTNESCTAVERNVSIKLFNQAGAEEFYIVAFRKRVYNSLEDIQQDLESCWNRSCVN